MPDLPTIEAQLEAWDRRPLRGLWPAALGLVGFLGVALVFTWPLVKFMGTDVIDGVWTHDAWLNVATIAWDVDWLTGARSGALLDAPMFHPSHGVGTYTEHLLGEALVALAVRPFSMSPVAWHDANLFLMLALDGLGAFLLVAEVGRSRVVGLLAGVLAMATPVVWCDVVRVQAVAFGPTLLCLFALLRWHQAEPPGRHRRLVSVAAHVALQWLFSMYFGMMLLTVVGLVGGYVWLRSPTRQTTRDVALAGGAVVLGLLPFAGLIRTYLQVHASLALDRPLHEVRDWWAPRVENLWCARDVRFFEGSLACPPGPNAYQHYTLWPGLVPVLLLVIGVVGVLVWLAREARHEEGRHQVLLFGVLVAAGVLSRSTLVLLAGWPVLALVERWRGTRLSPAFGWLGLTVALVALTLGPQIGYTDRGPNWDSLYSALYFRLPGFGALRLTNRFFMLAVVTWMATAAVAVSGLPVRWRLGGALLLMGLHCVDLRPLNPKTKPVPLDARRDIAEAVRDLPEPGAVVELPSKGNAGGSEAGEMEVVLRTLIHHRRIFNGHSGYEAPIYRIGTKELDYFPSERSLAFLRAIGVRYVVVHFDPIGPAQRAVLVHGLTEPPPGVSLVQSIGNSSIYAISSMPPEPPSNTDDLVAVRPVRARALVGDGAEVAIDGLPFTSFSSGRAQLYGDWLELTLPDSPDGLEVAAVSLLVRPVGDFARGLRIETSLDGSRWTTAFDVPMEFGLPELADEGRSLTRVYRFPPVRAHYIRLKSTAYSDRWWRVSEARVWVTP